MINSIDLTRMRNAEYIQFMKNVGALVTSNGPEALQVAAQNEALTTKTNELDVLFKKQLSSEITQEITALDERRDNAVRGIASVVDGYLYHFDTDKKQAATKLFANLKLYGAGIHVQNYQAETGLINGLIVDWETKPELTAALLSLGLTAWKDELKSANLLFDQKYLLRTVEFGQASPETMKALREATNAVYYALRQFIDAYAITINTPVYATVTRSLNALIDQYNAVLGNRQAGISPEPVPPVQG